MIKLDDKAFLQDRLLLDREDSKFRIAQVNEVLEVDFAEAELRGRNFALTVSNLEQRFRLYLPHVVPPEPDVDVLARALKQQVDARHFDLDLHARQDIAVPLAADLLQLRRLFRLKEGKRREHATV